MILNQQQNDTLDFSNKSHIHLFKGIFNIFPMPGTMIGIAYIHIIYNSCHRYLVAKSHSILLQPHGL